MLNPNLKLNNKIFDETVEKETTRKGFGEGLVLAADKNKNVVGLCADLNESTGMNLFAKKYGGNKKYYLNCFIFLLDFCFLLLLHVGVCVVLLSLTP